MVPEVVPAAVGVKVTDTVQLAAGISMDGQFFVSAKPPVAENASRLMGLPRSWSP
jgi:hypothetical protein